MCFLKLVCELCMILSGLVDSSGKSPRIKKTSEKHPKNKENLDPLKK